MEESNGGTNKANEVSKPYHPNVKINKKHSENFKGKKGLLFVCGKPGHHARECRYKKDQKGAILNAIDEEIIVILSNICVVQGKVQGWWYGNCAIVHVTYDKSLFNTFEDEKGD